VPSRVKRRMRPERPNSGARTPRIRKLLRHAERRVPVPFPWSGNGAPPCHFLTPKGAKACRYNAKDLPGADGGVGRKAVSGAVSGLLAAQKRCPAVDVAL